jgi:hypothetical protein
MENLKVGTVKVWTGRSLEVEKLARLERLKSENH